MSTRLDADSSERLLRLFAVTLTLILGLEWGQPLLVCAQPNGIPSTSAIGSELAPIQEVETIEDRKPFYKKWWFWTIVGVVVAGSAVAVAASSGGGSSSPPPSGGVSVKAPSP